MIYTIDNPKQVKDHSSPEEIHFTGVVKDEFGDIAYYVNGRWHREDGPARIIADGTKEYFLNDKRHREDGPARIFADGERQYWLNNKLHRTDGPAIILTDGTVEYWVAYKKLDISTDQELKDYLILRIFE